MSILFFDYETLRSEFTEFPVVGFICCISFVTYGLHLEYFFPISTTGFFLRTQLDLKRKI